MCLRLPIILPERSIDICHQRVGRPIPKRCVERLGLNPLLSLYIARNYTYYYVLTSTSSFSLRADFTIKRRGNKNYYFFSVALRPNAGHGPLILDVSRSHKTTHHSRQDSSGRVISMSQRPLPDNTRHSKTNIHAPGGIRNHDLSRRAPPQTYALDRAATGTGKL